jgi:hypothetical protein
MNKKFVLKKASLLKLKQVKNVLVDELIALQKQYDDLYIDPVELSRIKQLENEKNDLHRKIDEIKKSDRYRKKKAGIAGFLFGEFELNEHGEIALAACNDALSRAEHKRSLLSQKAYSERPYVKSQINRKKEFLLTIEEQIGVLEKKKEKTLALKNKAAQTIKEKRKLGSRVKQNLNSHECPYCFSILSKNTHADHIYPLAKGGSRSHQTW